MRNRAFTRAHVLPGLVAVTFLVALAAGPAEAQYVMFRSVIGGGGGPSTVGSDALVGTAGQMDAGTQSHGPYDLLGGFWLGGTAPATSVAPASPPPTIALATRIERAYPNPSRGPIQIAFTLAAQSDVRAEIYNLRGQRVRTLMSGPRDAGRYHATWDGRNESGGLVATGIYLVRFEAGGRKLEQKILVIH